VGATFSGRRRARSSAIRAAGGTPGRARRSDGIRLGEPVAQLPLEIGTIQKAPLFKEGALHPPDEILNAAFLLGPVRPAHLDADSQIERHAGKRRIPFRDDAIAAPLERDRLRPIEHGDQRNAAKGGQMLDDGTDERFHALVRHERDLDPARVLQPRRKELHFPLGAVVIGDPRRSRAAKTPQAALQTGPPV
jgi:hypothetical protein